MGQQAGEKKKKTERVTGLGRKTREEIVKRNQMTALRFQIGGRHQTSPASLRGEVAIRVVCLIQYHHYRYSNRTDLPDTAATDVAIKVVCQMQYRKYRYSNRTDLPDTAATDVVVEPARDEDDGEDDTTPCQRLCPPGVVHVFVGRQRYILVGLENYHPLKNTCHLSVVCTRRP